MLHNVCGNARIAYTARVAGNRKSVLLSASVCVFVFVYESWRQCVNVCTINNQFVCLPRRGGVGAQSIYFYIFVAGLMLIK